MPSKLETIHTILAQFREEALHKRDLGDKFERLICSYLRVDPLYAERFSDVWMFNEWPQKGSVGDIGIDVVAKERATGEFCGIQCKFYLPDHNIAKEDIDSYLSALGHPLFTSGMIVSTTDKWGKNAEHTLANQKIPITRLSVHDLEASPVDWSRFSFKRPQDLAVCEQKKTRPHQDKAIADILAGFEKGDRGKLIMACGTGKTFTALRLAEKLAPDGHVLFLVPSLSLLSQALREWTAEAVRRIHSLAVCSDVSIGKRKAKEDDDKSDITTHDLAFPATTSAKQIVNQHRAMAAKAEKAKAVKQMTVVFSTYQSIDAVSDAQKTGLPEFDLIICDEAHRTTGVTLSGEDESHFVKIHDASFIKGKKRLYMTATPRIYGDDAKSKAKEGDAELCSMDDPAFFGEEFHRLGFGEAVRNNLLSDYKVLVLAVDQGYVSREFQNQFAINKELSLDDVTKIVGCWNGLEKRFASNSVKAKEVVKKTGEANNDADEKATTPDAQLDPGPMRRAVAFSRSIKDSTAFVAKTAQLIAAHREKHPEDEFLQCELDHVDGTFNALRRNALIDWLKAPSGDNTCRILSNARCLSEGVDVPALDAVLFLNPRNSVVDVVQSVGRVMRRAEGKKYGYIILPIGIPDGIPPEEALKDNEKYKVVWQVLQALRAHDDRFNATINQIELNKKRPDVIDVIGVSGTEPDENGNSTPRVRETQTTFHFPQLEEWKDAIYAKIVLKCGDRRYWESWAKDVAAIAERHTERLKVLVAAGELRHREAFALFLSGLRDNINPSISDDDAIEMLSQHLITRPVFDALFEGYAFTQHNPVSLAMQQMLDTLHDQSLEKETEKLAKFYASVRERASGIDNAEGRQRIVIELYDKFFRTAFPKMAERLGIVYTPVEVVDFIIHSVSDALQHEFGSSLGDKDVHIIDPFTGTGTFIVRLLQSGLIEKGDLLRKYQHELHANEIVLLAYYIAAINIEETFHGLQRTAKYPSSKPADAAKADSYIPFEGIVLTDTFQLSETKGEMEEKMFPENNRRVKRQKQSPIRVVVGNPPYSSKQESENDSNKNLKYPELDGRIRTTYAERSAATNKNSIYDSYTRALRWASDRIAEKGIVGFVTNGSLIDANSMDGLRACMADDFSKIYVFNLRGNQRTSGETSRMEGGKIFGSGSRASIAISVFIKNPAKTGKCELFYYDIGDYLSREEKLAIIQGFQSINGLHREKRWKRIEPNADYDWINQRDPAFEKYITLGDKKGDDARTFFKNYSQGVLTSRDAWCYNFSRAALEANIRRTISFFNEQVAAFAKVCTGKLKNELVKLADDFVNNDQKKISWSSSLKEDVARQRLARFSSLSLGTSVYRPFCRQAFYYDGQLIHRLSQMGSIFPRAGDPNLVIMCSGASASKDFSALITDCVPNFHMHDTGQCFPLYLYEKDDERAEHMNDEKQPKQLELINKQHEGDLVDGYRRSSAITDSILADFRVAYETKVKKEDIFYYVYGVLHSPEYRSRFASDLKKMLPRLPFTREMTDFWKFSQAGRDLAKWHLNYETVEPWPVKEHHDELLSDPKKDFLVQKMTFARPSAEQKARGEKWDRTTIHYNSRITLSGIPLEAYDYVVNGKPAIEWIMERYQITVDKDSGIRNDPNDWAKEHKQPRYILDLIKRIIRVSIETMKIVNSLPPLNERIAK
jgi:predicted helicase